MGDSVGGIVAVASIIMAGVLLTIYLCTIGSFTTVVSNVVVKPVNQLIETAHMLATGDFSEHVR